MLGKEERCVLEMKIKFLGLPERTLIDTASHRTDVGITVKLQISSEQNGRTVHGHKNCVFWWWQHVI